MWNLKIMDLVNIIDVSIAGILSFFTYKTLQEMKKSREETYRPFLRVKLKKTSFNYTEKIVKRIFLENIGYRFAKNIKIKLKISEDIVKYCEIIYIKDEIRLISIPKNKIYIRDEINYKIDILDPKEKYFLKYIEDNMKNMVDLSSLIIKKKYENWIKGRFELKDITLFTINIVYQDVSGIDYNTTYNLKLMMTEIGSFTREGEILSKDIPIMLEI